MQLSTFIRPFILGVTTAAPSAHPGLIAHVKSEMSAQIVDKCVNAAICAAEKTGKERDFTKCEEEVCYEEEIEEDVCRGIVSKSFTLLDDVTVGTERLTHGYP